MELHDLTAAYALDALDAAEAREYERHLATCERCRGELAQLQEAAGALAFAVDAPPPRRQLRGRILEQARGERPNVVPLPRRRPFQLVAAGAALAAAAAVALGLWAVSLQRDLDAERSARADLTELLVDARARSTPLTGATGTLVVTRSGKGGLFFDDLPDPPPGKRYHAWVLGTGRPVPAGTFGGGDVDHLLDARVPARATVAVTVEDGPAEQPTSAPIITGRA